MNVALNGLGDWYKANQLSANPTKTKYINFGCRNIVVPAYLQWGSPELKNQGGAASDTVTVHDTGLVMA